MVRGLSINNMKLSSCSDSPNSQVEVDVANCELFTTSETSHLNKLLDDSVSRDLIASSVDNVMMSSVTLDQSVCISTPHLKYKLSHGVACCDD